MLVAHAEAGQKGAPLHGGEVVGGERDNCTVKDGGADEVVESEDFALQAVYPNLFR